MTLSNRYDSLFQFYSEKHRVDWRKLKAQAKAESNLNPIAQSHVGAKGLLQFMDPTMAEWGLNLKIEMTDPYNPEHSIHCGAGYMRWLLDQVGGNYEDAWSYYNYGIGNCGKLKTKYGQDWRLHLPDETKNYIARIKTYLGEPLI